MMIGVTGTAASGKSLFASMLKRRLSGAAMLELNDLVERHRLFSRRDRFGTMVVKLPALRTRTLTFVRANRGRDMILVGHLLPELGIRVDIMVVIRAGLGTLARRMTERGYPADKIRDNLVDEALDYCGARSEVTSREVIEIEGRAGMRDAVSYLEARAAGRRAVFGHERINKMGELLGLIKSNRYGINSS